MSSEMKIKTKIGNVPKLRFPEFRNTKEWQEKQLHSICQMKAGKFISASKINLQPLEGLHPCYGGNGLRGFTREYSHSGEYSLIGRQGALCGNVTFVNGRFYATEHAVVVYPNKKVNNNWLFYCLNNLNLNQYAIGQAQPGLAVNFLEKIAIQIPEQEKEQQKIADCLSSLDNVISLQTQKIDALQQYKKGLVQKLFPAEGEMVPELRFNEFKNEDGWEERKLSEICERIMDGTHFSPKSKSGKYIYVTSKNIKNGRLDLSDISYISDDEHKEIYKKCPVKKNDVLLTKDGANTGNCTINNVDFEFSLLSSVAVLRGSSIWLTQNFLYQLINSEKFQKTIQDSISGQAITRITLAKIGSYSVLIPKIAEQQKIADCLASLDELITAETQKLTALKTHKTGLMQQLFPTMDEING